METIKNMERRTRQNANTPGSPSRTQDNNTPAQQPAKSDKQPKQGGPKPRGPRKPQPNAGTPQASPGKPQARKDSPGKPQPRRDSPAKPQPNKNRPGKLQPTQESPAKLQGTRTNSPSPEKKSDGAIYFFIKDGAPALSTQHQMRRFVLCLSKLSEESVFTRLGSMS